MNSHNSRMNSAAKRATARIKTDHDEVRVVKLDLLAAEELSISDDPDIGGDPYNSTGQHVILKEKRALSD